MNKKGNILKTAAVAIDIICLVACSDKYEEIGTPVDQSGYYNSTKNEITKKSKFKRENLGCEDYYKGDTTETVCNEIIENGDTVKTTTKIFPENYTDTSAVYSTALGEFREKVLNGELKYCDDIRIYEWPPKENLYDANKEILHAQIYTSNGEKVPWACEDSTIYGICNNKVFSLYKPCQPQFLFSPASIYTLLPLPELPDIKDIVYTWDEIHRYMDQEGIAKEDASAIFKNARNPHSIFGQNPYDYPEKRPAKLPEPDINTLVQPDSVAITEKTREIITTQSDTLKYRSPTSITIGCE
jgi:hypothetical protein